MIETKPARAKSGGKSGQPNPLQAESGAPPRRASARSKPAASVANPSHIAAGPVAPSPGAPAAGGATAPATSARPLAAATAAPVQGLVIGVLGSIDAAGRAMVNFDGNPAGEAVAAHSLVALGEADIGKMLALQFERGDIGLPVVLGLLARSAHGEAADSLAVVADGVLKVSVNGEEVVLSASRKLTLKCGRASLSLDVDGNVELRGQDVLSRAAGQNRIKGSSISLN